METNDLKRIAEIHIFCDQVASAFCFGDRLINNYDLLDRDSLYEIILKALNAEYNRNINSFKRNNRKITQKAKVFILARTLRRLHLWLFNGEGMKPKVRNIADILMYYPYARIVCIGIQHSHYRHHNNEGVKT